MKFYESIHGDDGRLQGPVSGVVAADTNDRDEVGS